jgi:hypothetical protein
VHQDGFHGKTISCLFRNFSAIVTITPHPTLELVPNPEHDLNHFESLRDLYEHTSVKVSDSVGALQAPSH